MNPLVDAGTTHIMLPPHLAHTHAHMGLIYIPTYLPTYVSTLYTTYNPSDPDKIPAHGKEAG